MEIYKLRSSKNEGRDMKPDDPNIKAENILADSKLADNLITRELQANPESDKELRLAKDIQQSIKSAKNKMSTEHKLLLDQRIIVSIKSAKRRKIIFRISSAAVFLVMVGIVTFFNMTNEPGILRYAKTESGPIESEYTKLVLSGRDEIQIISKESKIEYSANGKIINIDEQSTPDQPTPIVENEYNTLIVPFGKRSRLTLPDNTVVWLNSGSKLIYPVKFSSKKREVFLEGEAMFKVSHDENLPFFVLTSNLDIKVLGTIFNVCAYSDDTTVNTVLESGSVEIRYKSALFALQNKEQMVPGMMAVYNTNEKSIVQTMVNTKNFTSWKDGYVILEKSTLGSIIKKLSRYYNVKIEFENPELEAETFSGYLDLRDSAIKVLELISEMVDIEIEQDDTTISIKKRTKSVPDGFRT